MMLASLIAVAVLAQAPIPSAPIPNTQDVKPAAKVSLPKASLPFVVAVPPVPFYQAHPLHLVPSRTLIPLTATLTLDEQAEQAREEQDLVAAINTERSSRGMERLTPDPLLVEVARAHSREMCALNYFAHLSPTPGAVSPADRYLSELPVFSEKRPSRAIVGENIFYSNMTSDQYNAAYAHQRLMASPDHRANILEPRFTKVGVGLYRDPQGEFWVTEMFLRDH